MPEILVRRWNSSRRRSSTRRPTRFEAELNDLLANYAGRPTPLTRCRNLPGNIYLKREDLLHGGAHKTNQVLAQGLLAKRMGKTRLIAETGAGQHGVATAIVGALLGFETVIYMGADDVERQQLNVFRMQLMGAERHPGGQRRADAEGRDQRGAARLVGELRDHPLSARHGRRAASVPDDGPRIPAGDRPRGARPDAGAVGRLPDAVVACVGGGSNAIGLFSDFIDDDVRLIGVEAAGDGLDGGSMARPCCAVRRASSTARRPTSCRMLTARSPTPGRFRRASIIPRLGPSTRT